MENQFKNLSSYQLNLMVAKNEMRNQPFVKYLPQEDIFGGVLEEGDDTIYQESFVKIITESGKKQCLDFCSNLSQTESIMVKGSIDIRWVGGGRGYTLNSNRDEVFFENNQYCRAIVIGYLLGEGILTPKP